MQLKNVSILLLVKNEIVVNGPKQGEPIYDVVKDVCVEIPFSVKEMSSTPIPRSLLLSAIDASTYYWLSLNNVLHDDNNYCKTLSINIDIYMLI